MSFFAELKRRNVFKVAAAYIVTSWLVSQVAELAADSFGAPDWVMKMFITLLALGLPFAIIFAWAFEMTPEGLRREKEVDRSQSITHVTGQKLNHTIIALLVVALAYFAYDKFMLAPGDASTAQAPGATAAQEDSPQSIAVLPFVNMSEDAANEYFSDGLTEELLNILAKIKQLHVAGRTSSFAFKGKDDDLRVIGEKLNVGTILEGSVRKDDARNRVRITAQLINVENGFHLWSETFDRELDDIFAIQEEVAGEVAKALHLTLLGEEMAQVNPVATTQFNAYDHYLHGLQGLNEYSYASLNKASEDFQSALALDPTYTPAQLGLVAAWQALANTGAMTRKEAADRSLPLLTLILQREPDNSDAHVLMGQAQKTLEHDAADQSLRKALELNPRNVAALLELGAHLRDHERIDEGMAYIERAAEIEPYSVPVQWDLCWSHMWMSNLQGALQACERIREIEPNNPMGYYGASLAYQLDGNLAQAVVWNAQAHEHDPDDYELTADLALIWLDLGDLEMADHWAEVAESLGADQAKPLAAKVTLLLHREQTALAAQLAGASLDLDNRAFSRDFFRNAIVVGSLQRGDTQAALDAYLADHEDLFEDPSQIDLERVSWRVGPLIEVASLLKSSDFASARAEQLLQAAESILLDAHPDITRWLADINWAALKATRGDKAAAIQHVRDAFNNGFRFNWRHKLRHWFVLENLHDEPEYQALLALFEADMERQREEIYDLLGMIK